MGKQGQVIPGLEPMVARLPVQVARGYLAGGLPHEGKEELYRKSYDRLLAMVKALADAKITVVAGTDALAGPDAPPRARRSSSAAASSPPTRSAWPRSSPRG